MSYARNMRRKARRRHPERYAWNALAVRTARIRAALVAFRGMTEKQAWVEVLKDDSLKKGGARCLRS